jgi:hypothetical protein
MAVTMKFTHLWDVMPCCSIDVYYTSEEHSPFSGEKNGTKLLS